MNELSLFHKMSRTHKGNAVLRKLKGKSDGQAGIPSMYRVERNYANIVFSPVWKGKISDSEKL